ncbi:MAG: Sjogren's syndrome/scleroderma autoantigen 1 family protein [Candidatus Methanomethylicaceae archaeon]|nr:Sjogren's syndrome/scleroderma autoantigen 1 family protein [Candidatus Verstraetearchaeota archaeon]
MKTRDDVAKKGAELLRAGATMLQTHCPDCKTPLFQLSSGEVICPGCDRKVVFVKSNEDEKEILELMKVSELEEDLVKKIEQLKEKMSKTDDPSELDKMAKSLSSLLDLLGKLRHRKS